MSKNNKNHLKVIEAGLKGQSAESIALDLGVTKERVCQLLRKYNIDTRKIRRSLKQKDLEILSNKITGLLENGFDIKKIREILNIKGSTINTLYKFGVDVRIHKKEEIEKRNKKTLKLYKKGLTAYEIIDAIPEIRTQNQVYSNICRINNSRLPKRINSRTKRGVKLDKKIAKLKKTNTFEEVTKILNEKGFTNLNNGKIKVGTVMRRYYRLINKQK